MRTKTYLRAISAAAAAAIFTAGLPASAEVLDDGWATLSEMGFSEPTPSQQQQSVITYDYHQAIRYSYEGAVTSLETIDTDGPDKVISLSADILFAPDKWALSDSAPKKLKALLADVPDGSSGRRSDRGSSVRFDPRGERACRHAP